MNYAAIAQGRAAARRQRAEYVQCLILRAFGWLRARLPGAQPAAVPCC